MLRGGVQHVIGMVCVLFAVLSASVSCSQHSEQYTHHTYDMLPHHSITYNNVVFLPNFNLNINLARGLLLTTHPF